MKRLTSLGSVTSARELRAFQERTTLVDDDPDPPPNPDPPPEPVGTVYVRKIELLLNGTPVDQVCNTSNEQFNNYKLKLLLVNSNYFLASPD